VRGRMQVSTVLLVKMQQCPEKLVSFKTVSTTSTAYNFVTWKSINPQDKEKMHQIENLYFSDKNKYSKCCTVE
jgi:Holliday junction resolvase-like predicted endonuclease